MMAPEGGRRGIPWGRRSSTPPPETPATEAPNQPQAPEAPGADGAAPAATEPTFERVEEHDAAEGAAAHSHPSYHTIDEFPSREPSGEPGYSSAQQEDEVHYAEAESPEEASAHARVVSEPRRGDDEEFGFHTGEIRPTGEPDAIEFVEVHKAFGRNQVLRGLNMALPRTRSR